MFYNIEQLARPEVEDIFKKNPVVILPVGATEQHGPHLPYGTDTFYAEYVAKRVADRLNAAILPTMPYGYSYVWEGIPGVISLKEDTFKALIKDISYSIQKYGCKCLVIITGHEANNRPLKFAIREIHDQINFRILYFNYPNIIKFSNKIIESQKWNNMIHACEIETSVMLAINENFVKINRALKEYPDTPDDYGYSDDYLGNITKSGIFGDATLATKEKGEYLLDAMVTFITDKVIKILDKQPK
ncbi:MAG TPA: creatininase family protein [Tepidanaerobacter syntrophicus]|uniref:creatininase family protein n=1 Tax=Tepidanaerobacter syntrophicus TaxID=224999 RepID=UPI00175AD875|nr:creatininase family protein [Tepidanaerobacter syntrophicus]HHV82281.1 creatininase family protein [Tepidanaerobacter syntrophicus]